jgi:autotransporter-associated beta strand protein
LGAHNALPTTVSVSAFPGSGQGLGNALDLAGYNQTVNGLATNAFGTSFIFRITNSLSSSISTLTLSNNVNQNFGTGGVIQDGAGIIQLVKDGTGKQTFETANSYSGSTTVSNGVLAINVASIANRSTVSLYSPGILHLGFATTNRISQLLLNGVAQAPGLYTSNSTPRITSSAASSALLVNTPPVAANVVSNRTSGAQYILSITNLLLSKVTDANGDPVFLVGVSATTNGATVLTDANNIYVPANSVNDEFTYTVRDNFGGTNSATVRLEVSAEVFGQGTPSISTTGGDVTVGSTRHECELPRHRDRHPDDERAGGRPLPLHRHEPSANSNARGVLPAALQSLKPLSEQP